MAGEGRERKASEMKRVVTRYWICEWLSYFLLLVFHFPRYADDLDSFKGVQCFYFFFSIHLNFTTKTKRHVVMIINHSKWIWSARSICTLFFCVQNVARITRRSLKTAKSRRAETGSKNRGYPEGKTFSIPEMKVLMN